MSEKLVFPPDPDQPKAIACYYHNVLGDWYTQTIYKHPRSRREWSRWEKMAPEMIEAMERGLRG